MENKSRGRPKTNKPIKTQVLQIRLTEEEKEYILDVSKLEDESAAQFIITAVRERAERLQKEQDAFDEMIRADLRREKYFGYDLDN